MVHRPLRLPDLPEALENTVRIARSCNVELKLGKPMLPRYRVPEGFDIPTYFRKVCEEGLERRMQEFHSFGRKFDADQYRAQLSREIDGAAVLASFDDMASRFAWYDPVFYRLLSVGAWIRRFNAAV